VERHRPCLEKYWWDVSKYSSDELVTVAQTAKSLRLSKMTIYRWIRAKTIKYRELAGFYFIPKKEVERLQNQRASGDQSGAPQN
jgi:excisionase family DNA binding protein